MSRIRNTDQMFWEEFGISLLPYYFQARYAGKQSARSTVEPSSKSEASPSAPAVVAAVPADLEKAVASQGDKVRELKASKAAKADIEAAVAVLLDLKKRLVVWQGGDPASAASAPSKKGKNKK